MKLKRIYEYKLPRELVYALALLIGVIAGIANSFLDIDFSFRPTLFGWLIAAIVIVVAMHEGVHGASAAVLGHRPQFGFRPPIIYITFSFKIPRNHFMLVAIAPFVILNLLFGLLYLQGSLKLFANLCFITNMIGATGRHMACA